MLILLRIALFFNSYLLNWLALAYFQASTSMPIAKLVRRKETVRITQRGQISITWALELGLRPTETEPLLDESNFT
jgi:hypothetical protein